MTTDANKDEQTQPIKVNTEERSSEDTSRINLALQKDEPAVEIPDWLIEFASQPSQYVDPESQHGLEAIDEPAPETHENLAPIVLETAEWHVVQAELEHSAPTLVGDTNQDSDQQVLEKLLDLGNFSAAADLVLKRATTKELALQYQRSLRSYLVLQEDRLALWNAYDELTEKNKHENTQVEPMEDEWKDR